MSIFKTKLRDVTYTVTNDDLRVLTVSSALHSLSTNLNKTAQVSLHRIVQRKRTNTNLKLMYPHRHVLSRYVKVALSEVLVLS